MTSCQVLTVFRGNRRGAERAAQLFKAGGRRARKGPRAEGRAGRAQAAAYLGGDDPVVRAPLRDVGLSTRRRLAVAHVHGPAVHAFLLPGALRGKERSERASGRGAGCPRGLAWVQVCAGPREGWAHLQGRAPTPARPLGPHGVSASNPRPALQGGGLSGHPHPQRESRGAFKARGRWKCHRAGQFKNRK